MDDIDYSDIFEADYSKIKDMNIITMKDIDIICKSFPPSCLPPCHSREGCNPEQVHNKRKNN